MNALLVIAVSLAAPPAAEVPQSALSLTQAVESAAIKQRTRDQWLKEVGDALRHQAEAEAIDQPEAYVRLISLYQDLLRDETLHRTDRNRMRLKLRHRILRLFAEHYQDLNRRKNKIEVVRRRAEVENKPEKLRLIEEDEAILAQWGDMLGQVLGGPGGGGRQQQDYGEDLVELIQRVIAPDFWDVNGGPGSIVYYKNLRVLVISATSEVHDQIGGGRGGLIDNLRRVGNGVMVAPGVQQNVGRN